MKHVALGLLLFVLSAPCRAQSSPAEEPGEPPEIVEFICPMDPDVRSQGPGKCPKCGMALRAGIPDAVEYPVRFESEPGAVRPGEAVELRFEVIDPSSGERTRDFNVVHDRIFHLLYVSHDLEVFGHEHPILGDDGAFRLTSVFPKEGTYRLLTDFYPQGATPQMTPVTLTTAGFDQGLEQARPELSIDLEPKSAANVEMSLRTDPPQPLATFKTLLHFELADAEGLEKFLGAWAHMLAASADLSNLIHAHPAIADGGPRIQMNIIFPEPGMYRIWVQVQRNGVVNTVPFTIEVGELGS